MLGAPQITSDGLKIYVEAIEAAFGSRVDYAQILKTYAKDESSGASRDDDRVVALYQQACDGSDLVACDTLAIIYAICGMAGSTGKTTSWAMRSNGLISNAVLLRFHNETLISPW
mgnify:CR=1 FL=1